MEADWEVEVGPEAPVIDALWPGFVDLRSAPRQAHTFPEVAQLPPLAAVLARLNAPASPVWTSRCDVWPLEDLIPTRWMRRAASPFMPLPVTSISCPAAACNGLS